MRRLAAVSFVVLSVCGALGACSDAEPEFGLPSAIKGKSPVGGSGTSATPAPSGTPAPTGSAGEQLFLSTVEPAVKAQCGTGTCHIEAGSFGKFFGATAQESYGLFKGRNFHTAPNFRDKGQPGAPAHQGGTLSDDNRAKFSQWMTAEQGGGATPAPADAGGDG
jgi:hypothetical protein